MSGQIRYDNIAEAIRLYESLGYEQIEVPWWVTPQINNITKPVGASDYSLDENHKVLVASGEQGFLYMANKGQLPQSAKLMAVTPCFRNEAFDQWHSKYFMKLELFRFVVPGVPIEEQLQTVWSHSLNVLRAVGMSAGYDPNLIQLVPTDQYKTDPSCISPTYDIVANGIEIGSYGARKCDFCAWIYGTGIAEPRFSKATERVI